MIKRHGTKITILSIGSDGRPWGVSESLQSEPLKTDGPLCVNFRRIKQGGYKKGMVIFAECT